MKRSKITVAASVVSSAGSGHRVSDTAMCAVRAEASLVIDPAALRTIGFDFGVAPESVLHGQVLMEVGPARLPLHLTLIAVTRDDRASGVAALTAIVSEYQEEVDAIIEAGDAIPVTLSYGGREYLPVFLPHAE